MVLSMYGLSTSREESPSLPLYADWVTRMDFYGREMGEYQLVTTDINLMLDSQYYDSERVFFQISAFRGESEPWNTYAQRSNDFYVNDYLIPNGYGASGYGTFPHGLYMRWVKFNDADAKADLILLKNNAAFHDAETQGPESTWYGQKYSREIAYNLQTNLLAERAGETRNTTRVNNMVDMSLSHIDEWVTGVYSDPASAFCQPFMTGLTSSALIEYYERSVELGTPDTRIPPALKSIADWLWENTWVPNVNSSGYGAFMYVDRVVPGVGGTTPSPDLNLLIVPAYGWLYKHYRETVYRDRGDLIFAGGVALADITDKGKRFNQSYRSSFDYVIWRA